MKRPHLPKQLQPQYFTAHETARLQELDGTRLASFRARGAALLCDFILVFAVMFGVLYQTAKMQNQSVNQHFDFNVSTEDPGFSLKENGKEIKWAKYAVEFGVPILYWGLFTYFSNGRTPGKWIAGVRVISTTHERIRFWQSIERALGYSVSALEAGLGFFQYFISTNRRATHDRLAETIVVRDPGRNLFPNGVPLRHFIQRWKTVRIRS